MSAKCKVANRVDPCVQSPPPPSPTFFYTLLYHLDIFKCSIGMTNNLRTTLFSKRETFMGYFFQ